MSIPDPWPDAGPTLSEDAITADPRTAGVNTPWRAALAVAELLVAVLLAVGTRWAWGHVTVPIRLPDSYGISDTVTRLMGSWVVVAVALATVAGLLVVDAVRQTVLAWGTGRTRKARNAESGRNTGET